MPDVTVPAFVRALTVEQTVVRCGCSEGEKASPDFHGYRGVPCHQPRAIEPLGTTVRWHRNPLRRAMYAVRTLFTGKV